MKRGISLVSLTVTMVVLIILLTTVTISGFRVFNNNKKVIFATEINMVQSAVDTYRTNNKGKLPTDAEVELDISQVTSNAIGQFNNEDVVGNIVKLKRINYDLIDISSLKYGSNDDLDSYLVSEKTGIVYYAKGLQIGQMTYYTLTDDLKGIISSHSNIHADNSGIIFEVSESNFTRENVVTNIKVPSEFVNVVVKYTVSSSGEKFNATKIGTGTIDTYTVDNVEGNYIVTVEYMKDGVDKNATYTVNNVDNVGPTITDDSIIESVVDSGKNSKVYLNLSKITDDKSGIKQIKYVEKFVGEKEGVNATSEEIANYFKNGGFKVWDSTIELIAPTKYVTIYAEDNVRKFYSKILSNI